MFLNKGASEVVTYIKYTDNPDPYKTEKNGYKTKGGNTDTTDKDTKDDTEQLIDFIEYKLEEIEATITKTTAKIGDYLDDTTEIPDKNKAYNKLVDAEKNKAQTYLDAAEEYNNRAAALLEKVPKKYRAMAQNGAIAIKDFVGENETEIAEAIQNYRDMAQKADDAEAGYLESIAQAAQYRLEQLEDIATDFDNLIGFTDRESESIELTMDLTEESGERLSPKYYKELIKNAEDTLNKLKGKKKDMQNALNDAVEAGDIIVGTDEWYEAVGLIDDVDKEILQTKTDMEGFNNAILELDWSNFDKFITEIDNVDSEISHLYDVLSEDDKVVDEMGNWTDEGITSLGLLAQQMETAQYKSQQYGKAIDDLQKDYKNGKYSTDEYNEKLAELKEKQWDSIKAYEQAKDSMVNLNKVRVESAKKYMQEEIDAYSELIEKKKEALNADREAHDFQNQVADQSKKIATIQQQLTAISGDNSAAATAKRRQLEAQLKEAQDELDETYYDRSMEMQEQALDNELESFTNNKQEEMDSLDEWLENEEKVVAESINLVKDNAQTVLSTINETAKQYGIEISDAITDPWKKGESAIASYSEKFKTLKDGFTKELDEIKKEQDAIVKDANQDAKANVNEIQDKFNNIIKAKNPKKSKNDGKNDGKSDGKGGKNEDKTSAKRVSSISGNIKYGQKGDAVKTLQAALNALGFNCGKVDGIFGNKTLAAVKNFQKSSKYGGAISADGIVGKNTKKKFKTAGYAGGTLGTKEDAWAIIDELGEELVLNAGENGRLQFLSKGTAVVPHDISENLIKLGELDPTELLEHSRPQIGAPMVTTNNITIEMNIDEVVHVDKVEKDTLPDLAKTIEKQMDKYMKSVNQALYGKVR